MISSIDFWINLTSFSVSFIVTFVIVPWLIPKLIFREIVGKDMNKPERPLIPEIGGISVVLGVFLGVYFNLSLRSFYVSDFPFTNFLLVSMITILGISIIGLLDDLLGMRQIIKAFLPFIFALPLGFFVSSDMNLPFFGDVDFGLAILFIVPFGITCAANSMNMLEGFNGLGSGLGLIITGALIVMSLMSGNKEGLVLLVPLFGSLLAFLYYNKYPAKIFPGDTLTLFMGGIIGCAAMPNLKLEGALLMLPMILEFFLKLKSNFRAQCFATSFDGNILQYNGRIESLTHFVMQKFRFNEQELVRFFWFFQFLWALFLIMLKHLEKL